MRRKLIETVVLLGCSALVIGVWVAAVMLVPAPVGGQDWPTVRLERNQAERLVEAVADAVSARVPSSGEVADLVASRARWPLSEPVTSVRIQTRWRHSNVLVFVEAVVTPPGAHVECAWFATGGARVVGGNRSAMVDISPSHGDTVEVSCVGIEPAWHGVVGDSAAY